MSLLRATSIAIFVVLVHREIENCPNLQHALSFTVIDLGLQARI